jgi:hypothetical protein
MAPPRASQVDPKLNFKTWHAQVLGSAPRTDDSLSHATVGRFWDQLARDLFLANMDAQCWGWSSSLSIPLLDYWRDFEPRTFFLLVCESPDRFIGRFLSTEGGMALDSAVAAWLKSHTAMLRFFHRNAARCLLVDAAACEADPDGIAALIKDRLDIQTTAGPVRLLLPENRCSHVNALLAHAMSSAYPELPALYAEVLASLSSAPSGEVGVRDAEALQAVFNETRALYADAAAHAQLLLKHETLRARNVELVESLALQSSELAHHRDTADAERNKVKQLSVALEDAVGQAKACDALRSSLREAGAVREKMQQELESKEASVQALRSDNAQLLFQMQSAQDAFESYAASHAECEPRLADYGARWERMLLRNPDYVDYARVEVLANREAGRHVQWRITGLHDGERSSDIVFATRIENGMLGIIFDRANPPPEHFLRWPDGFGHLQQLELLADLDGAGGQQRKKLLLALSGREWHRLQLILGALLQSLAIDKWASPPEPYERALRDALRALRALPPVPRFEDISLHSEYVHPDYEHVWLQVDGLSVGTQTLASFDIRLACGGIGADGFGRHPRIEFPEATGRLLFDSWYAMAEDEYGPKLELRFAVPDAMDLDVWSKLSAADRGRMGVLIAGANRFLETLRERAVPSHRSWAEWQTMLAELQRIFVLRTQPATQAEPQVGMA